MIRSSNPFSAQNGRRLFRVEAQDKLLWLCFVSSEIRTYVYIPDSGRFHLNHGVYIDFIWDNELTYVPIGVEEAHDLIAARVGALPAKLKGFERDRYLTDQSLDVAEVFAQIDAAATLGDDSEQDT